MSFAKLISYFKKKERPLKTPSLDIKLIQSARSRAVPRWIQLKYINRFLNKKEKSALIVSSCAIVLALFVWGGVFTVANIVRVPAAGGEYTEAMVGAPKFVNPLFASANEVDADLASLTYSGLFRYDKNQKLSPDLASEYKVNDGGKVYDIKLKRDVVWSDGEPFSANDVLFTFEMIQNSEVGSPLYSGFFGVALEKTDDFGVRFTLKEPFAPFLGFLTVGILPEHIWSQVSMDTLKLSKYNLQPVGTGPWTFDKFTKNGEGNIQTYALKRNENYYRQPPYLQTLNFKFFADAITSIDELRGKNVTAVNFIPLSLKDKISPRTFTLYQYRLPQYAALFFNLNRPILNNAEARQALAMAIDKKRIVNEVLKGGAEIADSPFPTGALADAVSSSFPAFSLEKANQLLDKKWSRVQPETFFELQYREELKKRQKEIETIKNTTSTAAENASSTILALQEQIRDSIRERMKAEQEFYRKNGDGTILRLNIVTIDNADYGVVAEKIASMWRAAGVSVTVEPINARQMVRKVLRDRNYDVLLYGEIMGNDPDPYPFWHSSQTDYPGINLSMFVNRSADKLMEEARTALDPKKRDELYLKFQKIFADELPAVFLYTPLHVWAVDKEIKGIQIESIFSPSDRFADVANWYGKTKLRWKK